jgi:hypothetical protein
MQAPRHTPECVEGKRVRERRKERENLFEKGFAERVRIMCVCEGKGEAKDFQRRE